MKLPLRIIHIEDNETDAELVELALRTGHVVDATICVRTREEFEAALRLSRIDLIISDSSLPGFDGQAALRMASAAHPETPFIFVSQSVDSTRAALALKSGAAGCVSKDNLASLAAVVRQIMDETKTINETKDRTGRVSMFSMS